MNQITDCATHQFETIRQLDQFVATYTTAAVMTILAIVAIVAVTITYRHIERRTCHACRRARARTHTHRARCFHHA